MRHTIMTSLRNFWKAFVYFFTVVGFSASVAFGWRLGTHLAVSAYGPPAPTYPSTVNVRFVDKP